MFYTMAVFSNTFHHKVKQEEKAYACPVTDEQIKDHLNRSITDIFSWLENTNRFVYMVQSPTERSLTRKSKNIDITPL